VPGNSVLMLGRLVHQLRQYLARSWRSGEDIHLLWCIWLGCGSRMPLLLAFACWNVGENTGVVVILQLHNTKESHCTCGLLHG